MFAKHSNQQRNERTSINNICSFIDKIFMMIEKISDRLKEEADVSLYSDAINIIFSFYSDNQSVYLKIKKYVSPEQSHELTIPKRIADSIVLGLPQDDLVPPHPLFSNEVTQEGIPQTLDPTVQQDTGFQTDYNDFDGDDFLFF